MLDIPSACATAAQSYLYDECQDGECAGYPHEGKHWLAYVCPNMKLRLALGRLGEYDGYDRGDDSSDGDEDGGEEGEK